MRAALALMLLTSAGTSGAESRLVEGNPKSTVRVVIFEDLQCSDCAAFGAMMDQRLLPRFQDKVAFEHWDFPLPKHAWARKAAVAARFLEEIRPELGAAFRRYMLAQMREVTVENINDRIAGFAEANRVERGKALAALEEARYAALVEQDVEEGVARGVSKTPTVFVDGQPFIERFTVEEISKAIEAALRGAAQ